MERIQQLSDVLLAAVTVPEAAAHAVERLVTLFSLDAAVLRIGGEAHTFDAGVVAGEPTLVPLHTASRAGTHAGSQPDVLELYGTKLSAEVRSTLASMISLVIARARSAEEKARIEATQRGEEMRSTVLNALAHGFKTPLTSIKAAASALRAGGDHQSPADRELAIVIDEEADRLNTLITESLNLERIEAHRANPRREACRISDVVASVTTRLTRFLNRREVSIHVPEDLPLLMADSFLLEQMLLQVVDNAVKYSKPASAIRISAECKPPNILISVKNEGSQILPSERELIFDKFYRGANDSAIEGTGLGLAIARTIAETYQGKIWLDAEPGGPVFHFSLPYSETEIAPMGEGTK